MVFSIKIKSKITILFLVFLALVVSQKSYSSFEISKADNFLFCFSRMDMGGHGSVDLNVLKFELKRLFKNYSELCPQLIESMVGLFRENGVFLESYKLKGETCLSKINSQFIFYHEEYGYCLALKNNTEQKTLNYLNMKDEVKDIKWERFLKESEEIIFSLPIENVLFERVKEMSDPLLGKFVAIYTHHKYSNMELVKDTIVRLKEEAKNKEWRTLYIDELGLILPKTIENYMSVYKLSEKDAFERVKKIIKSEVNNLAQGHSIYDSLPFYGQLYSYLAKIKMDSTIEDLDYELWREIVAYDREKDYQQAIREFALTNFENYIRKTKESIAFFYVYNMKERDELFIKQIGTLMAENPNTLIFTIRGLAHYGVEEKIKNPNWRVESIIVSDGKIYETFSRGTWIQTLWMNGIKFSSEFETLEIAKVFIQDIITFTLQEEKKLNLISARRISYMAVNRMEGKDIKEIFQLLKMYKGLGIFRDSRDLDIVKKIVYDWCVSSGFLEEELDAYSPSLN
ncbi:MAG: hypothetical protein P9M06_05700 [Candidatus Saelkia tenebricola]|nr:hypothetical protein [Candidatus Saelkia tenebricola]